MFNVIAPSGITTAQLDMTAAFVPLGIGLLSLLAVSAGMIVWSAVRSYLYEPVAETTAVAKPSGEQKVAA